ncbi:intraflagellar transport complex B protein 46 carboxy-terminal protein [Toxoplasma gondii GAB2-2007-GAL-DOM2]|uniref:Intraflagellar transport complex B protein 46 carboxy-terminal protein n=6 Tax=Toxoplasma gondii TaxID=5811 RepID=S7V0E4_TOXGG|nr:hypothetical protein TGGT1_249365 [Toxoplasma gondii GT1]KAF4638703.1 hypothetical protein TGRH88_063120 [Toxoplasma gondii]KFG46313.1 intraflagellar transport complex B protein 46 carboxy-terminal protein [Toxoplasma gondii GAB2-2007-GAL-DOM2]KFG48789.1 intraflagellar transport complex B protein 46 carboxy-terminal protein [Toxoplasma gondii p89]KFG54214.1 intraflagellar transport complex B protein 46 carboxy-terminal protein [Toxoplasma gondii FOU]RQX70621.1 intraflagellar transport compl
MCFFDQRRFDTERFRFGTFTLYHVEGGTRKLSEPDLKRCRIIFFVINSLLRHMNFDVRTGTEELDEPALQQSDPAALRLEFGALRPLRNSAGLQDMEVGCIEDEGESRRIQIDRWIRTVQRLRDQYPNTESPWASDEHAPDFEQLVREWPDELASLFLPHPSRLALEETHMSLAQLLKLGCALLDVPTRPNELNKALHALWMLYFELRNRERITST